MEEELLRVCLKDDGRLGYCVGKFPAVEINNAFYRLPKEHMRLEWAAQVPEPSPSSALL